MPLGVKILVHCPYLVDDLPQLRSSMYSDLKLRQDQFYVGGPLVTVNDDEIEFLSRFAGGGSWLDLNFWGSYYSADYDRGSIELYVMFADWLEDKIPGCLVIYGNDSSEGSYQTFDSNLRGLLLAHHRVRAQIGSVKLTS